MVDQRVEPGGGPPVRSGEAAAAGGGAPRSTRAIGTVRSVCEEHLAGRYELEIIIAQRSLIGS